MKVLKTTVIADGFSFLEAPRGHAGALWMSDTVDRKIYCLDLDGRAKVIAEVPERPFGLGFLSDGTPLVASIFDRRLLRLERDRLVCHVDPRRGRQCRWSAALGGELGDYVQGPYSQPRFA
jgi:sugar lactone lactonase YvrE